MTHNIINDSAILALRAHERALTDVGLVSWLFRKTCEEAVNKAADAQLEAEAAHERAAKAERTANEIWHSRRDLLRWLRNLERQGIGHVQLGVQP